MPLKFKQNISLLNFLQEDNNPLKLGQILHFCLSHLCINLFFNPKEKDLLPLIEKALCLYTRSYQERETLKLEALRILKEALWSSKWKRFAQLFSNSQAIYRELEGFYGLQNILLRPDLLVFKKEEIILWEFKLRKSDFKEEQLLHYKEFLQVFYPKIKKTLYLLTFIPFDFEILEEIGGDSIKDGDKDLSYTTQLTLFENLS